jgi:PAS domain S-box-containing protein
MNLLHIINDDSTASHAVETVDVLRDLLPTQAWSLIIYSAQTAVEAQAALAQMERVTSHHIPILLALDTVTVDEAVDLMRRGADGVVEAHNTQRFAELTRALSEAAAEFECQHSYRSIVDHQTELICRYDANLRLTFVNRAYSDWQGSPIEELVGVQILDKIAAEDRESVVRHVQMLTAEQPTATSIHTSILPDGSTRLIEWTDRAIFDESGQIVEYQGIGHDVTEREHQTRQLEHTRDELETYRQHLNGMLDTMQDALLSLTIPDRQVIFVSASFEHIYGCSHQHFLDDPEFFRQVVHPDDLQRALEAQTTLMRDGFVEFDHRIILPDGSLRWLHRRVWLNFDADGRPLRINDSARDITERKQAEAALRASEEKYRSLIDSSDAAINMVDAEGRFLYLNAIAARPYGVPAESLVGKTVEQLFPPDQAEQILRDVRAVIEQDTGIVLEPEVTIQGQSCWFRTSIQPVRDAAGVPYAALIHASEITEKKRVERHLQLLETAVEQSSEALVILDHDGQFVFANPAFTTITGYSAAEVIGKSPALLFGQDNDTEMLAALLAGIDMARPFVGELKTRTKQGGVRYIEWSTAAIGNAAGAVGHFVTILRDVTDRRQSEEALRASEKQLRSLIDSQTNHLLRTDMQGRYTYWNNKFAHDFGWLHPSGIGSSHSLASVCSYHHERTHETVGKCVRSPGTPFQVELDKPASDGSIRHTLWEFICLTNADGVPETIQCVGVDVTDLKRTQALAHYQADLLGQVSDAVIATDNDLKITTWNRAATEIYGWTEAEAIGQTLDDLLGTRWEATPEADALETIRATGRWRGEIVQTTKSGETRFIVAAVSLVKDEAGEIIGGVTVNRDVTTLKRRDRLQMRISAILESVAERKPLPRILEELALAVEEYESDMKASVLLLDPAAKQLRHGAAPSLPDAYNAAINGLTIGSGVGSCGTAAFERRPVIVEDIATHPFWARFKDLAAAHRLRACWSQPIIGHEGIVLGTFALYYEHIRKPSDAELELIRLAAHIAGLAIEHEQAEAAVRASEARYRSLVESADAVIAVFDAAGDVQFANELAAWQLHLAPEALIGMNMRALFPPEIADFQLRVVQEVIRSGRGVVHENPSMVAGNQHWYRTSIQPIRDADGSISTALVNASDITPFKAAEIALRRSEQRYRQMFELVQLPKLIIDPDTGSILDANPAAVRFYGYPLAELKTMNMAHINLASLDFILEKMHQVLAGEITSCIFEQRLADGTTRDVEGFAAGINLNGQQALYCTYVDVTERNRAKAALQDANDRLEQRVIERTRELERTKNRLEAIFNHSGDGIVLIDAQGGIQQANHAFESLFDLPPDGYRGKPFAAFFQPGDGGSLPDSIEAVIASHQTRHVQAQAVRGDGTPLDVEISLAPVNRSSEPVASLVCILRDITERKQAEQQLRYLASLQAHMYDAVIATGLDYRIQSWNKAAERMFGWSAEEVIGQVLGDVLQTKIIDETTESAAQKLMAHGYWQGEAVQHHRDGTPVHVLGSIVLNRDEHGQPIGVIGVNHDISERKRALDALRDSEEKFRRFVESAPIATVISDTDGRIVLVNEAAEQLFGYTRDELIGESIQILVPESEREAHETHIFDYKIAEHLRWSEAMELSARRKGGDLFPADIQLSLVNLSPAPLVMSFVIDISRRKEAEETLKSALAKEMELGDLKSRFVSMASHQFRTPLSSILATTETLTYYRDRMDEEQIDIRLDRIRQQVSYMKRLMEDVLELARIQAKQIQYHPTPGDLDTACRMIVEEFEHQEEFRGRVVYTCSEPPVLLNFDEHLMQHLISNLLHNALKYSSGQVLIRLSITTADEPAIQLQVEDHGIGIPEDDLKYLFHPFHRGQNVGAIAGTGLGLSIVKQAVDAHTATIQVESVVNRGTTFTVIFPANSAER